MKIISKIKRGREVVKTSLPLFLIFFFLISSCGLTTTRPKMEMGMAAAAFIAAKDAKAATLAPNLYRKAEYYYLKAKSSYKRKYFNKAKQYAIISTRLSEKAEFKAVRKVAMENY